MGLSARHKRDRTARSRVCVRCQIMTIIEILKKFLVKKSKKLIKLRRSDGYFWNALYLLYM